MQEHPQMRSKEIPEDLRHIKPHTLGAAPSDPRDYPARAFTETQTLPRTYRVPDPFPIKDQGALGSCVGNAVASMLELYFYRKLAAAPIFSALHTYFVGRVVDGSWTGDVGTYIRSALKGVKRWGTAPEDLWPYDKYDTAHCTTQPTLPARFEAVFWRPQMYVACATIDDIRSSIAQGFPVAITVTLTRGFYDVRATGGDVPETYDGEPANGAHALLAIGYDDDRQRLVLKNSWGTTVGANGYFSTPYSFWNADPVRTNLWDAWALR